MTDTYTGNVTGGGAADVRETGPLTIRKVSVGPMDNNAYLLTPTAGGDSMLIDAANDSERLEGLVRDSGTHLGTIVTTHRHPDHTHALAQLQQVTGANTVAGVRDAQAIPLEPTRVVDQGDTVEVGDQSLDVIALRGHTPGAIALAWTDPNGRVHLFTGDSLFPGGPGKTNSPEDFNQLMDDLTERVFDVYGDDTWVYPGHGKDTTLGAERDSLPEWRERGW